MLKEIAFTPQVFDQQCNLDVDACLESLGELGHGLFPRGTAPHMVASDLWDGAWTDVVRRKLAGIRDHRIRVRVQMLIAKLREIVVSRPHVIEEWPDDDDEGAWADEAVALHEREPIDRSVLTDDLFGGKCQSDLPCRGLSSVKEDSFWSGIQFSSQFDTIHACGQRRAQMSG